MKARPSLVSPLKEARFTGITLDIYFTLGPMLVCFPAPALGLNVKVGTFVVDSFFMVEIQSFFLTSWTPRLVF